MRVLSAGVSLPDIMAREGIHPETPRVPYTPGWDLVGEIESDRQRCVWNRAGAARGGDADQRCLRGFVCLPQTEWFRCHRDWTPPKQSVSF